MSSMISLPSAFTSCANVSIISLNLHALRTILFAMSTSSNRLGGPISRRHDLDCNAVINDFTNLLAHTAADASLLRHFQPKRVEIH